MLTQLANMATHPNTHDGDRYARKIRAEIRRIADDLSPGPKLVLLGNLFTTDRRDPVSVNQTKLKAALDVVSTITGELWRRGVTVNDLGEEIEREPGKFSNPMKGAELKARGIITDYNIDNCYCEENPDAICFAVIHTV